MKQLENETARKRGDEGGAAPSEQYAPLFISFRTPVMSQSWLAGADNLQEMVMSITAFKCALSLQPKFHRKAKSCSYFQDTSHLSLQNSSWWMTMVMAMAMPNIDSTGGKKNYLLSCLDLCWTCENGRVSPINLQRPFLFSGPHPATKTTSSF